tara:strand:- start:635 stop:748 length:114 start_codon:yes stop_codon:yes gene_type:complete
LPAVEAAVVVMAVAAVPVDLEIIFQVPELQFQFKDTL